MQFQAVLIQGCPAVWSQDVPSLSCSYLFLYQQLRIVMETMAIVSSNTTPTGTHTIMRSRPVGFPSLLATPAVGVAAVRGVVVSPFTPR
jgi:hypothetical protein